MEHSSIDRQAERAAAVLLGPAVSPRRRAGEASLGALAAPLPPFVKPRRAEAPAPEAAAPPAAPPLEEASLSEALEELVAAEPEAEDGLGLVDAADWDLSTSPEELPTLRPPAAVEAPPVVEPPTAMEPGAGAGTALPLESVTDALEEWSLAASAGAEASRGEVVPVEPEREAAPPAPRAEQALAEAMSLEEGPALQEVAGRLERIASALREGRPIELFSAGSSDPLEVLIAGYALGYSEAFRRVSEERRKGQ